jgi:broad specificity phosphatase PhoE
MITIFLARHATPDWSRKDIPYHIPPGPPLTNQGVAEAQALAEFMRQAGVQQLFVSPLERCLMTARIIADKVGAKLTVDPALIEVQPGEKRDDLHLRLWPVFEKACLAASRQGPTALITHGEPIAILLSFLGLESSTLQGYQVYDSKNLVPPGGVWQASQATSDSPWELSLVFSPNGKF